MKKYHFSWFKPPSPHPFPTCFIKDHLFIDASDLHNNIHFDGCCLLPVVIG